MSARYSSLIEGLKEALESTLEGRAEPHHINRLVSISLGLAISFLHFKRSQSLLLVEASLTTADLGYDCIAELFERDEHGSFIRLRTYFESIDVGNSTDEELLVYLRRLVFSSVNQSLMRIYNSFDPGLGKILRNMKLVAQNIGTFAETERMGEPCLVPQLCDPLAHLPVVELEMLQSVLSSRLRGLERIPDILSSLSRYLREQSDHSRQVPVMRLALAIRWFYASKQILPETSQPVLDPFDREDMLAVIHASCEKIRREEAGHQLTRGASPGESLGEHIEAVQRYLEGKLEGEHQKLSLFESLRSLVPGLTKEVYNREHRSRLEYLARKTEKNVIERLKKG
jgi:hypothetical protein